ncbi:YceG family protein [uncultured Ruminococcus sp.]|uniref:YceG family protein n=1 Tax=uncultured Ruminococcus sp. TaxID=165186 RepID=UPI0025E9B828|nr:YceG family protein [uncultured Ruminococcus sp.]
MFEHKKFVGLDDFFKELNARPEKGVYFYRVCGYNEQVSEFIKKYYEAARTSGVIIEGRIPNPDNKNLAYFEEMMGMDFRMELEFLTVKMKKWLPRMSEYQRDAVCGSIYNTLSELRMQGKNDNMLKNCYIKFMCWLYYKFERVTAQLGESKVPKILYEGDISNYELLLISVLSNAGCDVVLLEYNGDSAYLNVDPTSAMSYKLDIAGLGPFPPGYSLKKMRELQQAEAGRQRLYGAASKFSNCTNAWIKGEGDHITELKTPVSERGTDPRMFYNIYTRINGVWDKMTYQNDLYQMQLEMKKNGRRVVIIDKQIPLPTPDEINNVPRKYYNNPDQMIGDLGLQIRYGNNIELQRLMVKSFVDVMLEECQAEENNLNKLTNKAVYIICWLKRYMAQLFANWRMPEIACFIYMGGCRNENEAMFMRFLARLPVDVLILVPDLNGTKCCLVDRLLYEQNCAETLEMDVFPTESAQLQMATLAYHAERELDTLMYQDSGIYRNRQYSKANAVTLKTMYEEVALLWKEELKYRPNFSTVEDVVNMPVLFAKISGVKDGDLEQYWGSIKEMLTPDTFLITQAPYINSNSYNEMKSYSTEFLKRGVLQRRIIKNHPSFRYSFLRDEIQDHILDKLQLLIDSRMIKGTFENGTEYLIVATIMNLNMDMVRKIQSFDFTKTNPKLIYINSSERMISLEDSIIVAFLNLVGFDIAFFVPTGYQSVEKHFNTMVMEEHQIGQYVYDLNVPDLRRFVVKKQPTSWRNRIFKRGK